MGTGRRRRWIDLNLIHASLRFRDETELKLKLTGSPESTCNRIHC